MDTTKKINTAINSEPAIPCLAMKPRDAAKALGICERTLYTLTKKGEIPVIRSGRLVLYVVEDLKEWLKKSSKNS
jgi:excisionase family DNA binding protein